MSNSYVSPYLDSSVGVEQPHYELVYVNTYMCVYIYVTHLSLSYAFSAFTASSSSSCDILSGWQYLASFLCALHVYVCVCMCVCVCMMSIAFSWPCMYVYVCI